jgi:hypothetical protein
MLHAHKKAIMQAKNYQLIEVQKLAGVKDAGTRIYIGDQPQLRTDTNKNVQIMSVSMYPVTAVPVALSGIANAPAADFVNAFLVLNIASIDKYLSIPAVELNPVVPLQIAGSYAPAVREYYTLNKTISVDWTKSYIQLAAASSAGVFSYLLGVRYYVLPLDIMATPAI